MWAKVARNKVPEKYFDVFVKVVHFFRIWTDDDRKCFGISPAILVVFPAYILFFVLSGFEIYHTRENLEMLTDSLNNLLVYGVTCHKWISMIHSETDFKRLIHILDSNFFIPEQRTDPTRAAILAKCVRENRRLSALWIFLCVFTLSSIMLIPLTEQLFHVDAHNISIELSTSFPYRSWTPFDDAREPIYTFIYLFHVFMGLTLIFMIPVYDIFFIGFILHICAQFKILHQSLENLRENAVLSVRKERSFLEEIEDSTKVSEEVDRAMKRDLAACVRHHDALLKFVEGIESIVNKVLLSQFIGSSIVFCMTAFQITVNPTRGVKVLSMAELMFSAIFELGMFCYFANQVKDYSLSVGIAAYSSKWYHGSESFKRSIRFIMTRADRPAKITFGKFQELSLETFASILQISYTYFTVLTKSQ